MRKYLALLLVLAMTLSLAACASPSAVTYYYVRNEDEYLYGVADGVMVGESREAAGHVDDLRYLLILYFHGPVSDYLRSPFPSGTTLEAVVREDDALIIQLSSIVSVMEGMDLTLACACLARTCFGLTDVQTVTIFADGFGAVSMTLERDSLLLVDNSAEYLTEESQ